MLTLPERLKAAMKFRDISQSKLADKVGCSQGAISKLLRGESETSGFLPKIGEILDVSTDWLATGKGVSPFAPTHSLIIPHTFFPLVSLKDLAAHCKSAEDLLLYAHIQKKTDWESMAGEFSDKSFAVKILDDSMVSSGSGNSYVPGTIFFVDPEEKYDIGDIVVANIEGAQEATIRLYIMDAGRPYLVPFNNTSFYSKIPVDSSVFIIGRVVRTINEIKKH